MASPAACLLHDFGKIGRLFRHGHVASIFHEEAELAVGDLGLVHPETIDVCFVDWPGIGEQRLSVGRHLVATHPKRTSRNPNHAFRRRSGAAALLTWMGPRSSAIQYSGNKCRLTSNPAKTASATTANPIAAMDHLRLVILFDVAMLGFM